MLQCEPDLELHLSQPEDLAILFLTSGSTGMPKCVMLNHRNILSMTTGLILMGHFSSQESALFVLELQLVKAKRRNFTFISKYATPGSLKTYPRRM